MTAGAHAPLKLFQFPRMFAIPNLSPFCCKLETWLRIARIPYEVVDTPDPRKGPKGKLPFIEDDGVRIADSPRIIDHLKRTRGVDSDAHLDEGQRAVALLVQRTLEEHYAFVLASAAGRGSPTHEDAVRSRARDHSSVVAGMVQRQIRILLWKQGILRHSDEEIVEAALRDWRAVLAFMSTGPFFFGDQPSGLDAIVFGTLATTVLTPIESPIWNFLRAQPQCLAYAERMRQLYFPELVPTAPAHGQD